MGINWAPIGHWAGKTGTLRKSYTLCHLFHLGKLVIITIYCCFCCCFSLLFLLLFFTTISVTSTRCRHCCRHRSPAHDTAAWFRSPRSRPTPGRPRQTAHFRYS